MDAALANTAQVLALAHNLYARNETANGTAHAAEPAKQERPAAYKIVGIALAISSGVFIGISFVLKKVGLLRANVKYNEEAGEGYGYLKNAYWWGGMTLMIIGEVCNFGAYAFVDAMIVTPMGALSVVITAILSAIFLKERLSMVGKVACFLCIIGSVIIAMNAPESSVATIQEMQGFVIAPGFLSYAGVVILGSIFTAFWAGPRYGKKNMFVYISICSWIGALSVVATQGLGAAVVAQANGIPQFNQWFLYVLLVFVIATLLTEIIFLNKALNLFNAAMVTPTYYVYFTSTTIMTSAILFRGFKGTPVSIITVVNGFLTICSGVVLLQLSKSAKDVPDTAVFAGDLDQIHTIAEQAQPETEPKADAIRGAAAIVRRFSTTRQKMEEEEFKQLQEEKQRERLETVSEVGQPEYEWDGLRRRKTGLRSQRSRAMTSASQRTIPFPPAEPTPHMPLGWSHFPTDEELAELERPTSPGVISSIAGTIRSRARSVLVPRHQPSDKDLPAIPSPMHPMQLTEMNVPGQQRPTLSDERDPYGLQGVKTDYQGSAGHLSLGEPRIQFDERNRLPSRDSNASSNLEPPVPPPHGAKRQFSFQNVFKRHQQHGARAAASGDAVYEDELQPPRPVTATRGYSSPQVKGATEEERMGLVKGDSHSMPALPNYPDDEDRGEAYTDEKPSRYGRGITSPPRRGSDEDFDPDKELARYESHRERFNDSRTGSRERDGSGDPSRPSSQDRGKKPAGGAGRAFI